MSGNHGIDAFRAWLLDRPLGEIPAVLIPAWMEVHGQLANGSQRQCERLLNRWRLWVHEQAEQVEPEIEEQDA